MTRGAAIGCERGRKGRGRGAGNKFESLFGVVGCAGSYTGLDSLVDHLVAQKCPPLTKRTVLIVMFVAMLVVD